jgi:hypothetical protein
MKTSFLLYNPSERVMAQKNSKAARQTVTASLSGPQAALTCAQGCSSIPAMQVTSRGSSTADSQDAKHNPSRNPNTEAAASLVQDYCPGSSAAKVANQQGMRSSRILQTQQQQLQIFWSLEEASRLRRTPACRARGSRSLPLPPLQPQHQRRSAHQQLTWREMVCLMLLKMPETQQGAAFQRQQACSAQQRQKHGQGS